MRIILLSAILMIAACTDGSGGDLDDLIDSEQAAYEDIWSTICGCYSDDPAQCVEERQRPEEYTTCVRDAHEQFAAESERSLSCMAPPQAEYITCISACPGEAGQKTCIDALVEAQEPCINARSEDYESALEACSELLR